MLKMLTGQGMPYTCFHTGVESSHYEAQVQFQEGYDAATVANKLNRNTSTII